MKFGQKLVYIILKHLQKNAVENITLSPRKLISKFWSTGATMGGRGLRILFEVGLVKTFYYYHLSFFL